MINFKVEGVVCQKDYPEEYWNCTLLQMGENTVPQKTHIVLARNVSEVIQKYCATYICIEWGVPLLVKIQKDGSNFYQVFKVAPKVRVEFPHEEIVNGHYE